MSTLELLDRAFVAGRSETSWEQFLKDNKNEIDERKESAIECIKLMVRLLPPDEYGEDYDCEELQNRIINLGDLKPEDYKDL